jgi:cytochrome c biogenesis protein ResB
MRGTVRPKHRESTKEETVLLFYILFAAQFLYQLQADYSFQFSNLAFTVLAWLLIVALALWAIDRLFPRIQRSRDKRSERDA